VNVHEYQAKELLREYGVPVPAGTLATTPAEAEAATRGLSADVVVVKAQVHAGGRGKAGGIKLAKSANEAKHVASEILGMTLRSHQTGPEGKVVRKVYVEAGSEIESELYLAVVLDRSAEKLAIIASTEGGMEIEESDSPPIRCARSDSVSVSTWTRSQSSIRSFMRSCGSSSRRMPRWLRSTRSSSRRAVI